MALKILLTGGGFLVINSYKKFVNFNFAVSSGDDYHPAMLGILNPMKNANKRIRKLVDLIRHCWVHSGYEDCGFRQMTSEQKRLYNKIVGRETAEPQEHPPLTKEK